MNQSVFPDVKKIAVLRATALGDFIFALPALTALHETYPQAEIYYLGRTWHTHFLPGRVPGLKRVIEFPQARGDQIALGYLTDPALEAQVFEQLRAEQFDLALQMHGAGEYSNPFVLMLGARFTAGLKSAHAAALERWVPYIYYQNEVLRLLEVVALVGAETIRNDFAPHLPVLESDRQAAAPVLNRLTPPFVVLHPGSTDPRRCWNPQGFATVGDGLAALGLQVVLTGTGMEAERMQQVQNHMHAPVVNLCDQLSLPALVGLLAEARLFIGNDSGPLHLALAAGTPAVGLFWAEYVVNSLPLQRANFRPLIAWRRDCPRCGRFCDKAELEQPSGECTHELSFIDEIRAEEVLVEAEVQLAISSY